MTVTAIVVMNHENKLTTTKNPLLRIKEVEELIGTYTKDKVVFIDSCQFGLRLDQSKEASETFVVVDEGCADIPHYENLHPKSAEVLIKHYYKTKTKDVVIFGSPSQLARLKGHVDQILLVVINNPSKEPTVLLQSVVDGLSAKRLTVTTWGIHQSTEEHQRRYSVKILS